MNLVKSGSLKFKNDAYPVVLVAGGKPEVVKQLRKQFARQLGALVSYHRGEHSAWSRAIPADVDFIVTLTDMIRKDDYLKLRDQALAVKIPILLTEHNWGRLAIAVQSNFGLSSFHMGQLPDHLARNLDKLPMEERMPERRSVAPNAPPDAPPDAPPEPPSVTVLPPVVTLFNPPRLRLSGSEPGEASDSSHEHLNGAPVDSSAVAAAPPSVPAASPASAPPSAPASRPSAPPRAVPVLERYIPVDSAGAEKWSDEDNAVFIRIVESGVRDSETLLRRLYEETGRYRLPGGLKLRLSVLGGLCKTRPELLESLEQAARALTRRRKEGEVSEARLLRDKVYDVSRWPAWIGMGAATKLVGRLSRLGPGWGVEARFDTAIGKRVNRREDVFRLREEIAGRTGGDVVAHLKSPVRTSDEAVRKNILDFVTKNPGVLAGQVYRCTGAVRARAEAILKSLAKEGEVVVVPHPTRKKTMYCGPRGWTLPVSPRAPSPSPPSLTRQEMRDRPVQEALAAGGAPVPTAPRTQSTSQNAVASAVESLLQMQRAGIRAKLVLLPDGGVEVVPESP